MTKASSAIEIRPLTSLRAVAAGLVLFFHYYYHHYGDPLPVGLEFIERQGFLAVDIFFVLSGFVLTIRYTPEIQTGVFRWGDYLRRRVARIWPLYYTILGIWIVMGGPFNLSNLTFTQGFFLEWWASGNMVAWSLTIEESFYLVLPLILRDVATRPKAPVRLAFWSVGMVVLGVGLVWFSKGMGLSTAWHGFMDNLTLMIDRTLFGYMPEFALGIGAGLWYRQHGAPTCRWAWVLIVGGTTGVLATMLYASTWDTIYFPPYRWVIGLFTMLLIVGLCNPRNIVARVLSQPLPVYLGRISFALYLLHEGPLLALARPLPSPLFYLVGNFISAIFHELIEKPGHKLIMNMGRTTMENPVSQSQKNN